jgi:hypothetical protein
MANDRAGTVGILWRGERDTPSGAAVPARLRPIFDALTAINVDAEAVVYSDDVARDVRDQLLRLDGVLIWVDPLTGGRDRSALDAVLRDISSQGTWVSAHPDVILKMGTKEVVFRTRHLGWGTDTHLYDSFDAFKDRFPVCLNSSGPRVLKRNRGNGGIGVCKVETTGELEPTALGELVRIQRAEKRDTLTEDVRLDAFLEDYRDYFDQGGLILDQRFQPRITDGMIRCYMVQDAVVGFAHQSPAQEPSSTPGPVFGLPAAKTMFPALEPRFHALRNNMEFIWLPELQALLDIDRDTLPLLWDADFLYGVKDSSGDDTYVLCEINVSCVTPFPDAVPSRLAQAVHERLVGRASN